jgi:hypothetical protein
LVLGEAGHLATHRLDRLEQIVETRIRGQRYLAQRGEFLADLSELSSRAIPDEYHHREHGGR